MIPNIKKILFATDLSAGSKDVFYHAVSLAKGYDASLTILHVIQDGPVKKKNIMTELIGKDVYERVLKENEEYARKALIGKRNEVPLIRHALEQLSDQGQSAVNSDGSSLEVEDVIVTLGSISEEIVHQAEKNDCDMIVMGHRAHSLVAETLTGSTNRKVLRSWKKPVVFVPMTDVV
jgi:nucleotide-binding universal stress UspA family protein